MISRAAGWTWDVHDGVVTMVPCDATTSARVRYRERVQPLGDPALLARGVLEDGALQLAEVAPIEAVITDEGEYAVIARARGTREGVACERTVGIIVGDDWYAELDGIALHRALFDRVAALVRSLLRGDRLMLGVRRRRVRHVGPTAWRRDEPLPLFARYHGPDGATLHVYPAQPVPPGVVESFELLRGGPPASATMLRALSPRRRVTTGQLAGTAWHFEVRDDGGRVLERRVTLMRDERYLYTVYLDTPSLARDGEILDGVLGSIEALPEPVRPSAPGDVFAGMF